MSSDSSCSTQESVHNQSLSEFFSRKMTDDASSTLSEDDYLLRRINNLSEPELRTVLQHMSLVHPEVVEAALKHVQQQFGDVHSVMTEQVSNTRKYEEPPPPIPVSGSNAAHPSRRGTIDTDEDTMPQPPRARQEQTAERPPSNMSPAVPKRRSLSPPLQTETAEANTKAAPSSSMPPQKPQRRDISPPPEEHIDSEELRPRSPSSSSYCFLLYDSDGAKLMVQYSREATPPPGALAAWTPSNAHPIKGFKFTQNQGRAELIGNCASGVQGRKNYYSGFCQFVRLAKMSSGRVTVLPNATSPIEVDLFIYFTSGRDYNSTKVTGSFETEELDAVACLPKHSSFYGEDFKIDLTKWLTEGSTTGSASCFDSGNSSPQNKRRILSAPKPPQSMSSSPALLRPTRKSSAEKPVVPVVAGGACYLVYDPDSSGKLLLNYSRTPVDRAIGMWTPGPGHRIQGFKYSQNLGRSELIGNCTSGMAGRKNYFSGWCQYVRAAKAMEGTITVWDPTSTGLFVDVYLYTDDNRAGHQTVQLLPNQPQDLSSINVIAVACLPRNTKFYSTITMDVIKWLADASDKGIGSRL